MSKAKSKSPAAKPDTLFDRIATILDQARGNVVRAVNTNMVLAYWMIGREIVEEIQRGRGRAKYGEKVIEDLSARLTERYGKGFSSRNLQWFKQFYLSYRERITILHPMGAEFRMASKLNPMGAELVSTGKNCQPDSESIQCFSPQLSWSHYRVLVRVENRKAWDFYG